MNIKLKIYFVFLFSIFFILLLIPVSSTALAGVENSVSSAITETRITADGIEPDIYNNRVVWQGYRNGQQDIYMYDLSSKKETQITTSGYASDPVIYGNVIVWTDWSIEGYARIYMYDLSSKKKTRITTDGYSSNPSIYGDVIVWEGSRGGYSGIYMYNLSTSKETLISNNGSGSGPEIYKNRIVWMGTQNERGIYMYDLSTDREVQIAGSGRAPAMYVDRIVWTDYRNKKEDIYMYNVSTNKEIQIPANGLTSGVYGDIIIWMNNSDEGRDIYAYDLFTSKEVRVSTSGSAEGAEIYGDKIVWQDARNGNWEIYMADLNPDIPVAEFSATPTSGNAPLEVTFTDRSKGSPSSWNWIFGDGGYSTYRSPVHTYNKAGNYTVKLTAGNEKGATSKTAVITVLESGLKESSGSNSERSSIKSRGSSKGSPELQKNVEHRDTARVFIPNKKPVCFNFTHNATVVNYISFESKKTAGKTTAIVEDLKTISSPVPELPGGVVYKSFNVWVGDSDFGNSDSILNATIGFRVEKSWIREHDIGSSIVLNKYNDKKKEWEEIPVNVAGSDAKYLYFSSKVPGYSPFVITGVKGEPETRAAESDQTAKTGNVSGNVNTMESNVEDQASEEYEKTPGFGVIGGVTCLFCLILYRNKER